LSTQEGLPVLSRVTFCWGEEEPAEEPALPPEAGAEAESPEPPKARSMSLCAEALPERALASLSEPDDSAGGGAPAHDEKNSAEIKTAAHSFRIVMADSPKLCFIKARPETPGPYLPAARFISFWALALLFLALLSLLVPLVTHADNEREKTPIKSAAAIFFIYHHSCKSSGGGLPPSFATARVHTDLSLGLTQVSST
jgi:hypothetical protein